MAYCFCLETNGAVNVGSSHIHFISQKLEMSAAEGDELGADADEDGG